MKDVIDAVFQEKSLQEKPQSPLLDCDVTMKASKGDLIATPKKGRFIQWGLMKSQDCPV